MSSNPLIPRFTLLGVGYIGGSLALAARRAGLVGQIVGYDVDPRASAVALERRVIDEAAASPEVAVGGASMVLLASPVCSLGAAARRIAGALAPDATVIDVGGVKEPVTAEAEAALPGGRFVGCHPLAGAEHMGVGAADPDIFLGRACFVCPGPSTRPDAVAAARQFWSAIGCEVVIMEAAMHDRLMAAVSHLPHVAAFALSAALAGDVAFLETHPQAPTTSLRDTTRIADSSPAVWRDILLANREHLLPLMRGLERRVREMTTAVRRADGPALESVLTLGRSCRRRLVK